MTKFAEIQENNRLKIKKTDSVGREITDALTQNFGIAPSAVGNQTVQLPGLNSSQDFVLSWKRLKPHGCEASTDPTCGGSDGALENQQEKLYYQTNKVCWGSGQTTIPGSGEFLFTDHGLGIRSCNQYHFEEDQSGNAIATPDRFNPVVLAGVTLPNGKTYEFRYNQYAEITKIKYPTGSYETFRYEKIEPMNGFNEPGYDQTNRGVVERKVYNANNGLEQRWQYSATYSGTTYKVTTTAPKKDDPLGSGAKSERYLVSGPRGQYNFGFDNPTGGMTKEEKSFDEAGVLKSRSLTDWTVHGPVSTGDPQHTTYASAVRDPRVSRSVTIIIENDQALATLSENEYEAPGQPGSSAPTDPDYFAHLNLKRAKSHHYRNIPLSLAQTGTISDIAGYFNNSTVATISETDYLYDQNYKERGISSPPIESRVLNPSDNSIITRTQTKYDNLLPNITTAYPGGYTAEDYGFSNDYDCGMQAPKKCWIDPGTQYRGKPTTSRVWDDDRDIWIETHTRYDIFGNAISVRDSIGNEASTLFEDSTEKPYKYAYPTRTDTSAPDPTNTGHGTNEGSYSTTTYDFMTGLPLTVTDEFGQSTKTDYNDPLLRPRKVYGLGNFVIPIVETDYDDDAWTVTVRKQIDATTWDEAITYSDSLGRTIKTKAKDSQGDVFVETKYDFLGRVQMVTNPYRASETKFWSLTEYDAAGRPWRSREPVENQNSQNPTGNILGTTIYDLSTVPGFFGTVVDTTDAAQKKGRSITNALGQLILVDEPDSSGNLAALPQSTPNPTPTPSGGGGTGHGNCLVALNCPEYALPGTYGSYSTFYRYDATGNMVQVTQGVQNRWFKYDSLGRLIRVRQPEQEFNPSLATTDPSPANNDWTAGFVYDIVGNVIRATDANGVNIINEYDKANRVIRRCYTKPEVTLAASVDTCAAIPNTPPTDLRSTDTPTVEFFYDGKGLAQQQTPHNFGKGKLTKVTNGISATEYMTFDYLGRLTRSKQTTDGVEYGGGENSDFWMTYAYNLSGALVEERYPSGRVVKNAYESDGDLARIYGNATITASERTYAASFNYTPDGRISRLRLGNGLWEAAKFNSRSQVTELGVGHGVAAGDVWKLGYEYGEIDGSGNLDTSKNTGNVARQTLSFNGLAHPFVQRYRYDSLYRLTEAKETSNGNQTWRQLFDYDRYGNRVSHNKYSGTNAVAQSTVEHPHINPADNRIDSPGYDFDKNGNLIIDGEGRHFVFNADNKQREIRDASNNLVGEYFYDGAGKRVKKVSYGQTVETTVFVYSAGKLVAEYSSTPPPATGTTNFTVTDLLGSPRLLLNSLGEVVSRRDFLPFGEEIAPDQNVNFRTENQNYLEDGDDGVRQKFTGYQKDKETGLDFAEARMYENRHARFTAVDPLLSSGRSANPQTFNRYVYVANSPLIFTDPTGLQAGHWYEPVDANGNPAADRLHIYHYPWNPPLGEGYQLLTRTNRAGQLISSPEGRTHVLRFNPNGPYVPPPNYNSDMPNGSFFAPFILSEYEYKGYDVITSDAYEDSSIEHPADGYSRGSEFAFNPLDFAVPKAGTGFVSNLFRSRTASVSDEVLAQNILNKVSSKLAADPSLARTVLSQAEYAAGQNSIGVARMQYGNAMERLFWREVRESGSSDLQRLGGPRRADGAFSNGRLFDITTSHPITMQRHFARAYGNGLELLTYQRPRYFTTFPQR